MRNDESKPQVESEISRLQDDLSAGRIDKDTYEKLKAHLLANAGIRDQQKASVVDAEIVDKTGIDPVREQPRDKRGHGSGTTDANALTDRSPSLIRRPLFWLLGLGGTATLMCFVCCGGFAFLMHMANEDAKRLRAQMAEIAAAEKEQYAEAGRLWASGKRAEAADLYRSLLDRTHFTQDQKAKIVRRVIEFDLDQGNDSMAKELIDDALGKSLAILPIDHPRASRLVAEVQAEREQRRAERRAREMEERKRKERLSVVRKFDIAGFGFEHDLDDFEEKYPGAITISDTAEEREGLTTRTAATSECQMECKFHRGKLWQVELRYDGAGSSIASVEKLTDMFGEPSGGPKLSSSGDEQFWWDFSEADRYIGVVFHGRDKAKVLATNLTLKDRVEDAITKANRRREAAEAEWKVVKREMQRLEAERQSQVAQPEPQGGGSDLQQTLQACVYPRHVAAFLGQPDEKKEMGGKIGWIYHRDPKIICLFAPEVGPAGTGDVTLAMFSLGDREFVPFHMYNRGSPP